MLRAIVVIVKTTREDMVVFLRVLPYFSSGWQFELLKHWFLKQIQILMQFQFKCIAGEKCENYN